MPKKKQVIFQNSIPGKFIPRNAPPPGSAFHSGANDNRFNARMAELLASSSTINDENEFVSTKFSQDESSPSDINSNDPLRIPSKLFHRRIVTMLETLRKSDDNDNSSEPIVKPAHIEYKSQPITFGQLRQATISSTSNIDDKSNSYQLTTDNEEKYHKPLTTFSRDNYSDLNSSISKTSTKHQTNKGRLYYSPSLEQLFEQQNLIPQTKKEDEQLQKSSLTVDEILATYCSKVNLPTNTESHLPSSTYSNSSGFYIHPSIPRWNSSQNNHHTMPPRPPPRLVLNEQNRNRPPPPSYSSSIANGQRTTSAISNSVQNLLRPSRLDQLYPGSSTSQQLSPINSSLHLSKSASSLYVPSIQNPLSNNSLRPPPPRYQSPTSQTERSHLTSSSSSTNDPSTSTQQSKTINTTPSAGFDREFSRLLYGKDSGKSRRHKQKRKAYSDPVKKSVEEARRSFEKANRRVTTNLNKSDIVKEEDDDDDTELERSNTHKQDLNFRLRRRFQRQSNLIDRNSESTKKAVIPANPLLKRRIPSFLRVYSQASSSNDILLQWHLFNLSELESFYAMMTRLYKNENLARVQLYEIYRTALISALASKISSNTDDETDAITTPL